ERRLGFDPGTIRATVLIETITAAFEMDEILYELRERSVGLSAGRWDYIFSLARAFCEHADFVLPDRADLGMRVPFMRAYNELLVATCHRRGAHAIGGMAAFIPDLSDPALTEASLAKVRSDKRHEAGDGYDGSWVAHPDLVAAARAEFDRVLGDQPNQVDRQRDDVYVTPGDLLAVRSTPGSITDDGVRTDVIIAIRYLSCWLTGTGLAAIDNRMEDLATVELSRSQLWQWIRHGARLEDGRVITPDLVRRILAEETGRLRADIGEVGWRSGRYDEACRLFEQVSLAPDFCTFLTHPAYQIL
ncbi:MAG: malate synthase A, partial [Acidimicrobiales bacterium]